MNSEITTFSSISQNTIQSLFILYHELFLFKTPQILIKKMVNVLFKNSNHTGLKNQECFIIISSFLNPLSRKECSILTQTIHLMKNNWEGCYFDFCAVNSNLNLHAIFITTFMWYTHSYSTTPATLETQCWLHGYSLLNLQTLHKTFFSVNHLLCKENVFT